MIHYYCFHKKKEILVSDLPVEKIRNKFGYNYEIITSIKERNSIEVTSLRITRSYSGYIITELLEKKKIYNTEKARAKAREANLGCKRSEETRRKMSLAHKGRSNFTGKKHRPESRKKTSESMKGNTNSKDLFWVYDPNSEYETRIKNREDLPPGLKFGRDYYSIEPLLYSTKTKKSTRFPTER